jgi:hypothetical protein
MAPNDSDSVRPANPVQAGLVMAGCISFIVGLALGIGGNIQQVVLGTGLVVFAGLCLAAAAIRDAIAGLRKDD